MNNQWGRAAALVGIGGLLAWRSLRPEAKERLKQFVNDLADAIERRRLEKQRRERQALDAVADPSTNQWLDVLLKPPAASQQVPQQQPPSSQWDSLLEDMRRSLALPPPQSAPALEPDSQWRHVLVHPAVVLILGKRGAGKSALGYRLLELCRYQLTPYVVGVPDEARTILPDWIGIAPSLKEIPPKSIVLVDEAYLRYHSRESQSKTSKEMSQLLNLSRQREQTLIFVTQEARQVDLNISSSASIVVFKEPGSLQFEFERRELRRIAEQARVAFQAVGKDRRRWNYVYSPDANFSGLIENQLPSFWSARLSRLFATGQGASALNHPAKTTVADRRERARELRAAGLSYAAIARELGVSKSTAINYVNGYSNRK